MKEYLYCIVRKYTEFSNRKIDRFGSLVRLKYHDTFKNSDGKDIVAYFYDGTTLIEDYSITSNQIIFWKTYNTGLPAIRINDNPAALTSLSSILFEVTMLKEKAEEEFFKPQLQHPTARMCFYIYEAPDDAAAQLLYENLKEEGAF